MTIRLISFASGDFVAAQRILTSSALSHGADTVSSWSRQDIEATDFYRQNRVLLDARRGAGYWVWKPYIILEELRSMRAGDVLIYSDTGRKDMPYRVDSPLRVLVDWCVEESDGMLPGTYIPEWGENRRWTKGECFRVMDCEADAFRHHSLIQATFSVWQRHDRSIDFVSEWLRWCKVPAAIADERTSPEIPDDADFIDHRHDQSVLTLLALKHGLTCYGQPDEITPANKYISSLIDRIAGRTWSMRRRLAREERRISDTQMPGTATSRLRRAKRFAASWVHAVQSYP